MKVKGFYLFLFCILRQGLISYELSSSVAEDNPELAIYIPNAGIIGMCPYAQFSTGNDTIVSTLATKPHSLLPECPFTFKSHMYNCQAFRDRVGDSKVDIVTKGIFLFGNLTILT